MIPDYMRYHGSVVAELIAKSEEKISFRKTASSGRLLNYIVNEAVAIQIKYATQRLRPWHFSFPVAHLKLLRDLHEAYPATYVVLVCRTDGMLALHVDEIFSKSDQEDAEPFWMRADRKKRGLYRLYGPTGEFNKKFRTTLQPILSELR